MILQANGRHLLYSKMNKNDDGFHPLVCWSFCIRRSMAAASCGIREGPRHNS